MKHFLCVSIHWQPNYRATNTALQLQNILYDHLCVCDSLHDLVFRWRVSRSAAFVDPESDQWLSAHGWGGAQSPADRVSWELLAYSKIYIISSLMYPDSYKINLNTYTENLIFLSREIVPVLACTVCVMRRSNALAVTMITCCPHLFNIEA